MKSLTTALVGLALVCGTASADLLDDNARKLWAHEQAHKGKLMELGDRDFLDRVVTTLEVCETSVKDEPQENYKRWYKVRVAELKGPAAERLKGLSTKEATSLLKRVVALPVTLDTAVGKGGGWPGWSGSSGSTGATMSATIPKAGVAGGGFAAGLKKSDAAGKAGVAGGGEGKADKP
jgi:hypothetical protein